ncbi:MAG: pitrilysin family protein [Bacteroides sp.]|jgi:predicted Zn-dependent peptidase|nr:pitrilysin family protein [Bacteroides sp.]
MTTRTKAPPISLITHLPFPVPEKQILGNGVPVYLLRGGSDEIVKLDLLFLAGSFHQHKPLVTYLAANLLKAGTEERTSMGISEILDFYGAIFQVEAQKDIVSVSLLVLKKNLGHVLPLIQEIIQAPSYPQGELEILIKNQKHQHIINSRKVSYLARLHFAEQLFGSGHPYGYRLKRRDFDQVVREDLFTYHRQWIHPGNLVIIVSGQLPGNMLEKLGDHFGGQAWQAQTNPQVETAYSFPEKGSGRLFIQQKDALQSAIRVGKRIIRRNHPDYYRLVITNALLGGFFGSRLMKNIRQEKGYTYGVNSALVSLLRDGYFFVSTQVGTEVCEVALEQIYFELKRLRTEAASRNELQTLKNYLSGNFLRSFDGPFAQAERFKEMLVFGLKSNHFDQFLSELKSITPETIMETAEKHLLEESMIEVVAGKP